jgi:hypothetical protein
LRGLWAGHRRGQEAVDQRPIGCAAAATGLSGRIDLLFQHVVAFLVDLTALQFLIEGRIKRLPTLELAIGHVGQAIHDLCMSIAHCGRKFLLTLLIGQFGIFGILLGVRCAGLDRGILRDRIGIVLPA